MTKPKTRKKIIKLFQLFIQRCETYYTQQFDEDYFFNLQKKFYLENLKGMHPYFFYKVSNDYNEMVINSDVSLFKLLLSAVKANNDCELILHSGLYMDTFDCDSFEEMFEFCDDIVEIAKTIPTKDIHRVFYSNREFIKLVIWYHRVQKGAKPSHEYLIDLRNSSQRTLTRGDYLLLFDNVTAFGYAPANNKIIILQLIFERLCVEYHSYFNIYNEIFNLYYEIKNALCAKVTTDNNGDKRTSTLSGFDYDYTFYIFDLAILLYARKNGFLKTFFPAEVQEKIQLKIKELKNYCTHIEGNQPKKGSIDEEIKNTYDDFLQMLVNDFKDGLSKSGGLQLAELIDMDMAKLATYIINRLINNEKVIDCLIGESLLAISNSMHVSRPSEQFKNIVLYDALGPTMNKWLGPEIFQYLDDSELQNLGKNKMYEFEKEHKRNAINSVITRFNIGTILDEIVNDYFKKIMKQ